MQFRLRDLAAILLVAGGVGLAFLALAAPSPDRGLRLAMLDGRVVVASVATGSAADLEGLGAGMTVEEIDFVDLTPLTAEQRQAVMAQYATREPFHLSAGWTSGTVVPQPGEAGRAATYPTVGEIGDILAYYLPQVDDARNFGGQTMLLGLGLFGLGIWWTRRQGGIFADVAVTLPVALAYPLLLVPLERYAVWPAIVACGVLLPLSQVPLALDLAARIPDVQHRRWMHAAVALLAIASAVLLLPAPANVWLRIGRVALAAAIAGVPGLIVAARMRRDRDGNASAVRERRLIDWFDVAIVAVTLAFAIAPLFERVDVYVWPLVLWLVVVLIARGLTVRPLMRLASRATLGRDVALAATEAERARIAADIHDEVLQDVTMLVRRLDAAGDADNAEAAREIAARLRAICGELRLPILDDLGVGPALEWLVSRFEPLVQGAVYLERVKDEPRLPTRVELGVFRIAQEALTNAVKHGKTPIVVRYRSGDGWCELDVDDSGEGVPSGAAEAAEAAGHFGLLNMTQRAEQIEAALRVGRRPGGGTRVSLVWEASATVDRKAVEAPAAVDRSAALDPVEPEASA